MLSAVSNIVNVNGLTMSAAEPINNTVQHHHWCESSQVKIMVRIVIIVVSIILSVRFVFDMLVSVRIVSMMVMVS